MIKHLENKTNKSLVSSLVESIRVYHDDEVNDYNKQSKINDFGYKCIIKLTKLIHNNNVTFCLIKFVWNIYERKLYTTVTFYYIK